MSSAGVTCEYIRQCAIVEAVLADNNERQPFGISMEFLEDFVYLRQFLNETTFEYLERFRFYLDKYPNYGLPFYELINHFLSGILPEERYELDVMGGGSIMNCTPSHAWNLIEKRAESTRLYVELTMDLKELRKCLEKMLHDQNEENSRSRGIHADQYADMEENDKNEKARGASPETKASVIDEHDLNFPINSFLVVGDALSKATAPRSAFSYKAGDSSKIKVASLPVIASSNAEQSDAFNEIKESLLEQLSEKSVEAPACIDELSNQTSDSNLSSSLPLQVNNPLKYMALDQSSNFSYYSPASKGEDQNCYIMKTEEEDIQEIIPQLQEILPQHRRYDINELILCGCTNLVSCTVQKSHSTFGWKPGWNSWRRVCAKTIKKVKKSVTKFDGVHPWAPNIH